MTPQAAIPLPETFDQAGFEELKAEIAAYVADQGEEWTRRIEAERAVPPELRIELKERGYLSLAGPVAYGGRGIPFSRYLELLELFAMSHASLRMIVHVANGVWRSVDQFATEQQRMSYVMPAVTGDLTVAFTLTEPTAGTGADLRCEVERDGDTYYLSGEKHLITFGVSCDRWLLFARLAGTKGADGTVALLVDRDTPNVQVEDMGESLGVRGTDHAHLVFDRAPVPVSDTLGEEVVEFLLFGGPLEQLVPLMNEGNRVRRVMLGGHIQQKEQFTELVRPQFLEQIQDFSSCIHVWLRGLRVGECFGSSGDAVLAFKHVPVLPS